MKSPCAFSFGVQPVIRRVQDGRLRGMIVVGKRLVGAQRLFQFGQRKSGIGGEEGARRVDGFQHHFAAAAAAHAEAEHAQQIVGLRRFAARDPDHFVRRRPACPVPAPATDSGAPA